MAKRIVEKLIGPCTVRPSRKKDTGESIGMQNRRTLEQAAVRSGYPGARSGKKLSSRRTGLQAGAVVFATLLALAIGIVSAADVCKLSVCWFNEQDKNNFECENGCYFEEDPLDASNAAQCTSLARPGHEDSILYMYRDNSTQCAGGCVTVGIGNLLRTVEDAVALQGMFLVTDANGQQRAATEQEIRDEFNGLPHQPEGCAGDSRQCYGHAYYGRRASLAISPESSNQLCQARLDNEFIAGLKVEFGEEAWNNMPSRVQYALVDITYNVGVPSFRRGWPNFRRAISNQDWETAATESRRGPPIPAERNAYVRGLLEEAAADKQAGTDRLARCP